MDGEKSKDSAATEPARVAPAQPAKEPWPFRYQLILRSQDQRAVAVLLVIAFVGAIFSFAYKAHVQGGFVDIDRADRHSAQFLVDINSAAWPEIANLPGIGPKLANAIVDFRVTHGPYADHDQLIEVPGIGPAKLEHLRQFLAPVCNGTAE
jgi:competence protein ComEA